MSNEKKLKSSKWSVLMGVVTVFLIYGISIEYSEEVKDPNEAEVNTSLSIKLGR